MTGLPYSSRNYLFTRLANCAQFLLCVTPECKMADNEVDIASSSIEQKETSSKVKALLIQLLLGLIASAGALSTGMSLGFSAIALPQFENSSSTDYLNPEESSWFASIPSVVTPVGCLICGPLLDRFGRRTTLLAITPTFLVGWLLLALSPQPSPIIILYLGRIFTGFATGMASIPGVVYLAEISQQSLRGMLVTWPSVAISLGILLVYILGAFLKENWRLVAGISAVFPILAAVSTFFIVPESPTWLLSKQKDKEAEKSFKKIRSIKLDNELEGDMKAEFEKIKYNASKNKNSTQVLLATENNDTDSVYKNYNNVQELKSNDDCIQIQSNGTYTNHCAPRNSSKAEPIETISSSIITNGESCAMSYKHDEKIGKCKMPSVGRSIKNFLDKGKSKFSILLRPEAWKPLLILNGYFFFQQFSGIYVVVFYAVDIVKQAGVKIDAYLATVLLGVVQLVAGIATSFAMTRCGRRPLSMISGVGMAICMLALAVYLQVLSNSATYTNDNVPSSISWVPLVAMLLYVVSGAIGFHTLPWAMVGELYPAQVKGVAGGITTCMAYLFNFAALKIYPALVTALGGKDGKSSEGVFYFYGIISIIATLFVAFFLTETHGKTLQDIEDEYVNSCNVRYIPCRCNSVRNKNRLSV